MKRVAVILSGCGVFDGSEIFETVLTLRALDEACVDIICAAPDIDQKHVVNHATGEVNDEEYRNVLEESARITRGNIVRLREFDPGSMDAVIFVGGFGAAKNLSSFAFDGAAYDVDPMVREVIEKTHASAKPLGFICIAPVLAAHVLGGKGVQLTIGNDTTTAAAIESKGAQHVECAVDEIAVDEANKVVSTPAYMLAERIIEAEAGINKLVEAVLARA